MDTLKLLLPNARERGTLDAVRTCGEKRRAAHQADKQARAAVAQAVAVALGAGVTPATIVEITTETYTDGIGRFPCWVYSRQGAYNVIHGAQDPAAAHAGAGAPDEDTAAAALTAAVRAALPAVSAYELSRDALIRTMWEAIDADHTPTQVAGASGFASATAYKYLGARERWNRVSAALDKNGLLEGTDGDFPLLLVRNYGAAIAVCNFTRSNGVQRNLRAALDSVGERLGAGRIGNWIVVHPKATENATA